MNYLMLDKDDITKSYGKISKKELLKELGFEYYCTFEKMKPIYHKL